MERTKTFQRKKLLVVMICVCAMVGLLAGRLVYLMIYRSEYYEAGAKDLHERERQIKAARGKILDTNGVILAANKSVCTISVIHSQVEEPEKVIQMLVKELNLSEENVRKSVEKVSSREKIKSNVEKEIGDVIRSYGLAGVKIDEDYKRFYPYGELASKVLGFTGGDNQGIIGLEVIYDKELQGEDGKILTLTDASGVEIEDASESRMEPVNGNNLRISLDYNIQMYAEQAAQKVLEQKQADSVSIVLLNPQNGEIYCMVNVPEFDLNAPFEAVTATEGLSEKEQQDALNQMWRNQCINDTYEPGSTFKVITASAALEEQVVKLEENFFCPGYITVEDRRIRCHKVGGHGSEDFIHSIMNSCNPTFIELGLRLGVDRYFRYFEQFGLQEKTGIDLPGEAATIMHAKKNVGQVELATIAFGQSFQITPIQLATTVASLVNGGTRITPHLGVAIENEAGDVVKTLSFETGETIVSAQTSQTMCSLLEKVVSEGTGKKAAIEGYAIGGKTATSQTLPRSAHKYISSFVGFAPADDPVVLGLVIINDPQGIYYGGTIAAPVMREIFENVLPYMGIEKSQSILPEQEGNASEESQNLAD